VVGSGPAGLAAADQLNKAGHWVTVFERSDRIGGLLRYGIPDFKLEKHIIDRRLKFMEEEGIIFRTNAHIGVNVSPRQLTEDFDAVVLTGGASAPRNLPIPGRDLKGVHFAMEFLTQQNKRVAGDKPNEKEILATDKHVLVIGGGDTGSDCVGTSHRHGAKHVLQIELLTKPPEKRDENNPWPRWPMILRTSSSHEEGGDREWSILTKEFTNDGAGNVKGLKVVDIEWVVKDGKAQFEEVAGTERELPCDLALLAIGFLGAEKGTLLDELGVDLEQRGNIKTENYLTNKDGIFSAGDMRRGQSLVVWAISEGREAARAVDSWLMGHSNLESKDESLVNLEQLVP
jgi:glutamate synthase (NADPH/NADH) small chain